MNAHLLLCGLLASASFSVAESNIHKTRSLGWSANTGWMQWLPDAVNGVHITAYVCSGFIYSPNLGWINVGSGKPENGIRYQNQSATDFGVNLDNQGNLRGAAYGANIGWIQFEDKGAPRIDFESGDFRGFAYGANIGWMNLGELDSPLSVAFIDPGTDADNDGIPDAWELEKTGTVTTLSTGIDSDSDGQTDRDEYLSDTDPLDPIDNFHVMEFMSSENAGTLSITWTSRPHLRYTVETSTTLGLPNQWLSLTPQALTGKPGATSLVLKRDDTTEHACFRIRASRPLSPSERQP